MSILIDFELKFKFKLFLIDLPDCKELCSLRGRQEFEFEFESFDSNSKCYTIKGFSTDPKRENAYVKISVKIHQCSAYFTLIEFNGQMTFDVLLSVYIENVPVCSMISSVMFLSLPLVSFKHLIVGHRYDFRKTQTELVNELPMLVEVAWIKKKHDIDLLVFSSEKGSITEKIKIISTTINDKHSE